MPTDREALLSPGSWKLRALALAVLGLSLATSRVALAAEPVDFQVKLDVVKQELDPGFCWFHPRVASVPGLGKDGNPLVVLTIQKHLVADDYYSGLYFMKSTDLGKTWTDPVLPKELDWRKDGEATVSVADVTPGWHPQTKRVLAIGVKVRYSPKGAQLNDKTRSYDVSYAAYDPATDAWTAWRELDMPLGDDKRFSQLAPGCVQWLIQPDGTVLLPIYYQGTDPNGPYSVTVLKCGFDGKTLSYQKHGDELRLNVVRGLVEPSLTQFQGKYYLTIRNDLKGYVAVSDDGLKYGPMKEWTFDDGTDLGSYNTQQHWVTHQDGLFLAYTRRGANNDHIPRNRAPLFMAQVDPERLVVLRKTEKSLMPERGVMLGNFGATAVTEGESWVTDSEFITGGKAHEKGANGSTFAARVLWSRPNKAKSN